MPETNVATRGGDSAWGIVPMAYLWTLGAGFYGGKYKKLLRKLYHRSYCLAKGGSLFLVLAPWPESVTI